MAKASVEGVGPDAPTVTDPKTGAKQSKAEYRCDLFPPLALLRISKILAEGCGKYGAWNWFSISHMDHINHALIHIYAYLAGDETDDHLGHAACRMAMALERSLADESGIAPVFDTSALTPYQRVPLLRGGVNFDDQPF